MAARAPDGTVFEVSGPPEAPAVLLIHGLGLTRACWQWTRPALEGRYRVIAHDLIGHGESPAPVETPSLTLWARQAAALLDHLGIASAAVAGFSLGGMVARRLAQDAPERVAALAVLHSAHRRSAAAQDAIRARVAQARTEGPAATVEAALERWFTAAYRAANPEMMALVRRWVLANDPAIYHRNYAVLADGVAEIVAPEPPIACPALVLTGEEDYGNGPEMTRAIAAEIAGAEALVLPGLRHMALAEAPEAVNAPLLRFLGRSIGGGA